MRIFYSVFFLLVSFVVFAQSFTISGRVKDASNGETMIGATVFVKGGGGAITNEYGFYSLSLKEGNYTIIFRYLGFKDVAKNINLTNNRTINVELQVSSNELKQAVVSAKE